MEHLGNQIALKWEKSHSEVMGWVCARMAFTIYVHATNLCLRGSRVKWRSGLLAVHFSRSDDVIHPLLPYVGLETRLDGAGLPHFPH